MLTSLAALLSACNIAAGNESDDTLRYYLSKSELVVVGTITNEPLVVFDSEYVPNYICKFNVSTVLKGDEALARTIIPVTIVRFEKTKEDKNPLVKRGGKCILFLRKSVGENSGWETADFWFGIQDPFPWLADALSRVQQNELSNQRFEAIGDSGSPQPQP